jgi:hypothetical protein
LQFFCLFLLLPVEDNGNAEAMLSSYPAAPNMRHIIGRGAADDSVFFLLLSVDYNDNKEEARLSSYPAAIDDLFFYWPLRFL